MRWQKRAADIVLGTILAALATPVILALALTLTVSLRTWPFFVHQRVGQGGRLFRFVKLRTLPRSTIAYGRKPDLIALPRFYRFLRRAHLDELPQLFLVVTGRMSLVGPRPKLPEPYETFDPRVTGLRQTVPQGCTGLWQIGAHTDESPADHPEYDLFYVRHAGTRLDAWIVWRTLLKMLGLGRPVRLDQPPTWVGRRALEDRALAGETP